jgi:uncharacterized tellurite resistance protein B-like protein
MSTHLGYRALYVSLSKLLITAAWVDGEVNDEEKACLRNLILKMPEITADDWRKLKIYLAYPQNNSEQEFIVKEFSQKIFVEGHSKFAWHALYEVLKADGELNTTEKNFSEQLENDIQSNLNGFLRKLKFYLFRSSIESQRAWNAQLLSRDKLIHEFFENPVYFLFRKAIAQGNLSIPHSKPELQKVCLFASILSWIAHEDGKISLDEENTILSILTETCEVSLKIAESIVQVAKSVDISDLELDDLVQTLSDSTQVLEREKLFIAISKIALIDRILSVRELECLRTVALFLGIRQSVWEKTMGDIHLKTTFSE